MIARRPRLVGAVRTAVIAFTALTACRVDDQAFESRVFVCDTAARDPHCGTDQNGQDMTCFPASQLDGTDFCTAKCGEPMSLLPDESAVCVQGNAKLQYCDPSDKTTPEGPCGRSDLGCLRTDVTSDEGICVTMQPCDEDANCPNPVRSTCAATFLKELYSNDLGTKSPQMHSDHLYCLQKDCVSGGSSCAPGQSCLPKLIPAAAHPPDICVPNCDSNGRCPPNHFCYKKLSGPANPAICIPGLLGFLCETDIDCLVGQCMSDNDPRSDLRVCGTACANDDDCTKFDSAQGKFSCVSDTLGTRRCATPDAYRGATCYSNADCTREAGTICSYTQKPDLTNPTDQGTCLRPCDVDAFGNATCAARGGFGHVCIPFVDQSGDTKPGCYPGYFWYPCLTDDNCVGENTSCRGADLTTTPKTTGNCTTLCQTDEDCNTNRWTSGQSFCAPNSICVPFFPDGTPCQEDKECQSKRCAPALVSGDPPTCEAAP